MMYTNPRTTATMTDWPSGQYRTTAHFRVEAHPKRGERGVRVTIDPKTGRPCKPKTLTYADKVRIVDGDDGKTYFLEQSRFSTHLSVMQSNMQFQQELIDAEDPRYEALCALVQEA